MAYSQYAIDQMNKRGAALLDPKKAKPPTPTPAKTTTAGATTLGVGGSRASEYSTAPKISTTGTYISSAGLGNQKVGGASPSVAASVTEQEMPSWIGDGYNGGSRDVSGTGLSQSYYDDYLRQQQAAIQARIDSAVNANNAYIPQVNQQSDKALQDAYIAREQNRVNAPQALSALGYTGGASETALMGINTGYENSRNTIETNRQNSLNDIYENERQIRAKGDATKAEAAASYYDKLIAAQQQAARDAQSQANWQAEYDLQAKQYEDAAAQQAWQNAYDERVLGLKESTASKSGSESGGGGDDVVDKNISGNYNVVLNNVKRALGGSNAGGQAAWNAVINYIQNSQRQGMITEYEAQQMINQLGMN